MFLYRLFLALEIIKFLKMSLAHTLILCHLKFQYLETRFDNRVRLFGAVLFTFGTMLWLPIVIYVPALAFNQGNRSQTIWNPFKTNIISFHSILLTVTGVNVHLITPLVCLVCIFYTCVGGLKAVVFTDCIQ